MRNISTILTEAIPGISPADLDTPFGESGIQSLDAIILRDSLERHFGLEIPDSDWYSFGTPADALAYCNAKIHEDVPAQHKAKVCTNRSHEVTMPKMANAALSENWLLKEMGDMHWDLLSKGLEQRSSEFTDSLGNRLYAAFVRIRYSISPLDSFRENDALHLDSEINRYGNYTYYSHVNGNSGNKTINADLATSFSARKDNDNSQIQKSSPEEKNNHVPEFGSTPGFYTEHRLVKKGLVSEINSGGYDFKITGNEMESLVHTLNPYYEINGVGLVYFAVYPVIADSCASAFFRNTMEMQDYDRDYHTIHRDTFYFANCNANDRIVVKLNAAEMINGNRLKTTTSLYRESDNKLMAVILTVKQKSM